MSFVFHLPVHLQHVWLGTGVSVGKTGNVLAYVHHTTMENTGLLLLPLEKQGIILVMILYEALKLGLGRIPESRSDWIFGNLKY